ncbi:CCR4-NOT transcription complex subunit 3 [Marchantia polymorpha subsp. ruderalis]|uniref:CCR4-NOT transcription complex subunit 3 n=2 Tax=Marchantia polymorpha TaxID=3197 RepID=A0AAF6BFH3_MARPO|nr:hypothetical protein MARPO_0027s0010 [Marchantia polymorpha]BBN10757.1 hypothetical protein Mp_5g06180 [Marchantia polymorpha subsp. ruderalis]PTQ42876.1 hypothetical protein MARPO_0027s0010 [Marchantia polymorpha]PTQ42877.1 hypothetical protein MARPO_0027s0010 [Marchantia polymorpha]BBN10758.1 hypothetical protein Mp_5g06180 [Marchantia polymorpha subsp. ruderalis]|eukprot:PTQ42875.1 hypothetical protein MARPO_0027s0010 [Marchantia polymorpha]
MGATRKLQGEIDRVLKKVQEGVDVFDSIWNKVYDTENANQKEKFEADLKKEIKKLQRYRDQIKTWIQSSEIKDKKVAASYEQALLDARKLIEREMERFKVCEKETKTKAFSKEGLGQQPKTDPREKAKGESRDWLNNMVSDLESQIDSFEAEMEGLSVKKGKSRPPRLTHLEESIIRHKAHIMKLELILRLLDNDELSPDEVNDVRDFVEDYVERNQDDFDDFASVDDLYQSLPLDKMEALDTMDAIPAILPAVVVKEKVAAGAPLLGLAPSVQGSEEGVLQDLLIDSGAQTPAAVLSPTAHPPAVSAAVPVPVEGPVTGMVGGTSVLSRSLTSTSAVGLLPATKGLAKVPNAPAQPSVTVSIVNRPKEEDVGSMAGRRLGPSISDGGLVRPGAVGTGSGAVGLGVQPSVRGPLSLGGGTGLVGGSGVSVVPIASDSSKRTGLVGEDRVGLSQQLAMAQQNRMFAGGKLVDASSSGEATGINDGASRVFSPPLSSTGQWRPHSHGSQSQGEPGQYMYGGNTGVAPDLKQKFLQRLQQVQQQNHSAALLNPTSAPKQQVLLSPQQQNSLLQQAQMLHQQQQQTPLVQPFQSAAIQQQQQQQVSLAKSASVQLLSSASSQAQQQSSLTHSTSQQQLSQNSLSMAGSSSENVLRRDLDQQAQLTEDNAVDTSSLSAAFANSVSLMSEDDLKNHDTFDVPVGGPGTLAEFSALPRDADFSPRQVAGPQSSSGPGVIGRRDNLGAIGDNLMTTILSSNAAMHDQQYNKDALASAYQNIPLPADSERPKSYVPKHPAIAPSSYPQVPVPIIDNPALWEHLDTEILFFAFYFQQGTYQQYMAARELKKQSWRYHKKYNTWFQRHEEPKITTDEYEQGTYVYFDFHIVHDDHQQGWCQRIKTEFTFEYSYLEDELIV